MITGATLIDYRDRYDTKEFLEKRFSRTFIPFIAWSVIGLIIAALQGAPWEGFRAAISDIFTCKTIGIFWFFPSLFAVYLSIPIIPLIQKERFQ